MSIHKIQVEFNKESFNTIYANLEKLGDGQYAQVFKSCLRNPQSDVWNNEKFFANKKITFKNQELETIKNEIHIMNKIKSKYDELRIPVKDRNVIALIDYFKENKSIYLVLELVAGGELFIALENTPDFHFTEQQSAKYMLQIFKAAEFMHKLNIVHLDLKPENVLCDEKLENLKVADFGLSIDISRYGPDQKDNIRHMGGTLDYVSPEALKYEPICLQTDMWSIGVILYILVSGLSPFSDDDDNITRENVIKCEYDFHFVEFDYVSPEAKDIIKRLLLPDPKSRMLAFQCKGHDFITNNIGLEQGHGPPPSIGTRTLSQNFKGNLAKINKCRKKWRILKNAVVFANNLTGNNIVQVMKEHDLKE